MMKDVIIDVRESDEFHAEHVPDSIHLPLGEFLTKAPSILTHLKDRNIVMMCRSGKRADLALKQALGLGIVPPTQISVFEGGILEWKKQSRPTSARKKTHFPIMRQVQLIVGLGVLTASILAYFVNPAFVFIAGFFGAGLSVAGATGFCALAELLAIAPWNRVKKEN